MAGLGKPYVRTCATGPMRMGPLCVYRRSYGQPEDIPQLCLPQRRAEEDPGCRSRGASTLYCSDHQIVPGGRKGGEEEGEREASQTPINIPHAIGAPSLLPLPSQSAAHAVTTSRARAADLTFPPAIREEKTGKARIFIPQTPSDQSSLPVWTVLAFSLLVGLTLAIVINITELS